MSIARLHSVACMLTMALLLALPTHAAPPDSFAPIVEPLMQAVVNISTTQKVTQQVGPIFDFDTVPNTPQGQQLRQLFRQFGLQGGIGNGPSAEREVTSLGSGFVIDAEGYIATNNHVIGNAEAITVIFHDNTRLPATIVGRDEKTDLALLKVKFDKPLPFVKFGDSDLMHVGDWVIAIGNPFGLGGSVSAGIISARGRNINAGPFDDFIQTDAAINRGNSGGPLFNTRGEVVGINSAIFSPSGGNIGIGFAVPSAMAKTVFGQLREFGTIHRGWLGIKVGPVTEDLANSLGLGKARGALVVDTNPGGPAANGGLIAGDVVLKFDGRDIDEMRKLPRYVADTKTGKKVDVVYWRKGHEFTAPVVVGALPKEADADTTSHDASVADGSRAASPRAVLGMNLVGLSANARRQLHLPATAKGVVVDTLDRSSEAAKRGIRPGDIVTEVNETPVESAEEVQKAINAAKKAGKEFALVHILRGSDSAFVPLPVK